MANSKAAKTRVTQAAVVTSATRGHVEHRIGKCAAMLGFDLANLPTTVTMA